MCRQINPELKDDAGYGAVLRIITAHDSTLQGYRRMFLTAQSFLISATSVLLRFGDRIAPEDPTTAINRFFTPAVSTALLVLGVISMVAWRVVSSHRGDSVTYLNFILGEMERGGAFRKGFMSEMVQPFLRGGRTERKRLIAEAKGSQEALRDRHRIWMAQVLPAVYGFVWLLLAAAISYAWIQAIGAP